MEKSILTTPKKMERNKIPTNHQHYQGHEEFISRLDDFIHRANGYKDVFTSFLTPAQQHVVLAYVPKCLHVQMDGGYEDAERKRASISIHVEQQVVPITCLKARYSIKFLELTHRDVLGAVMSLGMQRSSFGDVVVQEGHIYIFVDTEIANYVMQHLVQIKNAKVRFSVGDELPTKQCEVVHTKHSLTSLRLDCVVAAICKDSRKASKLKIEHGLVKVHHLVLEDCSYVCNNNCVISIRGYGRFELIDLSKVSKKGKVFVEIGQLK